MIKLNKVCKTIKGRKILDDISLEFKNKGLYILLGDNGAGKTTLLGILSLLDGDFEGEYLIDESDVKALTRRQKEKYRKDHIAYILGKNNLLSFLRIEQTLNGHTSLLKGIDLSKYPSQLSGGEQQLVAFSLALGSDKTIYLLDEITSSLDDQNTQIVLSLIKEIAKDHLVIFATHDSRVYQKGDNIIKLKRGNIV